MDNIQLQQLYEKVYSEGKEKFFTFSTADVSQEVLLELAWDGLEVLEIGCGTGETAYMIATAGGQIRAIDFAEAAIAEAKVRYQHPNLSFQVGGFADLEGKYDAIVLQEVIEHLDNPAASLAQMKAHLKPHGLLIITCPSFLNLRGVVWMTLQILLDVPMTLSDINFICPFDMERWADQLGFQCSWRTFRHGQAHGDQMIVDMKKRLTHALRDAGLPNHKVDPLLDWLREAARFETDRQHNGAKALYRLTPWPIGTSHPDARSHAKERQS